MLDRGSPQPLYLQMENILRKYLSDGTWQPGMLISSENELSAEFGLSRMTVRSVITKLVLEGLLFRIPGKGTYVSDKKLEASTLFYAGVREQLERRGYEVSTTLLSVDKRQTSSKICNLLGLPEDTYFYVLERLRSVKDEPFSLHISYIPAELCPGLDKHDLLGQQLCSILSGQYGLKRKHTAETIEVVNSNARTSHQLNIKPRQSLLLLEDIITDENGRPFEYSQVFFRGEKIKIKLEF